MTVTEIYKDTVSKLSDAGVPEPESDARILLDFYLGITRSALIVDGNKEIDSDRSKFDEAMKRRCAREPLQYITGVAPFMGLDFCVNKDVLVPRADTEVLVEELMKDMHSGMKILDMCTGSGCILISLLNYSYDCEGVGADLSEDALVVARENAAKLIPDKNVKFVQSNLFEAFEDTDKFDLIVSNPPYIVTEVIEGLMPEVKDFEPMMALDGFEDGLFFYREIANKAGEFLNGGGCLAFEIGYDQGEAVKALMENNGYIDVQIIKDYSGNDRVVKGIKTCLIN